MHEILPQSAFQARRQALLDQLPDNSAVVLYGASQALRNGDVHFPFRQNSYFWYLTGFPEPDAIAVLEKTHQTHQYTLYSARRDPSREIWDGRIIGQEDAVQHYGADAAYPLDKTAQIASQLANISALYTVLGVNPQHDAQITQLLRAIHAQAGRGGAALSGVFDLRRPLDELRLHKTPEEIELLRRAAQISAQGHRAAMLTSAPGVYEYQVQAALENAFLSEGCHWSFGTIAAGGKNACCLHYHANNAPLRDGDLMMVDAGAEWAGYAGDISRTHPVNGRFSRDQQALYEIVLNAQTQAIDAARPGIRHAELHALTRRALLDGMLAEGIIGHDADYWLENNRFAQFYMHGTGHWLGLDVHDVGVYFVDGQSRIYRENMVITVEPGLYIQADDTSVDARWRGMGIRIEDDVVITADKPDVLSSDIPKTVADIEALLRERPKRS